MNKRTISTIILLSVLASSVSCGGTSDVEKDITDTSDIVTSDVDVTTEDPRYAIKEELPEKDYGGYDFRIYMRDQALCTDEMFAEELTGDIVNDAVYDRNLKVQDRFNVKFSLITASASDGLGNGAMSSILAGDDEYDLIVPHAQASFSYGNRGLALDWNTELPYVDLDKPWWDQNARDSFDINDKLYTMVGDISYLSLAFSDCMFFNKALFDKYNEEYPYQKVLDGKWTFDEFTRIAKLCSEDLNGDGELKPEDDLYGYATYVWVGPIQVLYSGGGRVIDKNKDGELELCYNTERNIQVYDWFFNLLKDDSCYIEPNRDDFQSLRRTIFDEGRAMMIDGSFNDVSYLRDMKDDFGIVPWPKYDESSDGYAANVDAGTDLFVVPITTADAERTSIILEALCAEGYRSVIPAYYEVALQKKYTRDDISVKMIDIIKDSRVFDTGYFFGDLGGWFSWAGRALYDYKDQNFSSFYAKYEAGVNASIKKISEKYGK